MAVSKAEFFEIGRRHGLPEDLVQSAFDSYDGTRAKMATALGDQGIDDETAKKDIELLFQMIASNRGIGDQTASAPTKKKGLFRRK
jgi:hypothetical protein